MTLVKRTFLSSTINLIHSKASFKGHEPCPKCGSRDNLGRYSDGSAWCFGCHYREPPRRTLENVREKNNNNDANPSGFTPTFDVRLDKRAVVWLKSYGITDEEIHRYGFLWDPQRQRLVFPIYKEGEVVFWQGRRFGEGPKYLSWGRIPEPVLFSGPGRTVIFTEDAVSAIKVARRTNASPLFGSHVPANALKWASERFSGIGVWLDPDKAMEGSRAVLRAQAMGYVANGIYSPKDPKEHSDTEIASYVQTLENSLAARTDS